MGHHSHTGGAWIGDYYIVAAEAVACSPDTQRAYVHRVKEIMHDGKLVFPVKDGTLLPADPVDRANAKVEGSTVLQGEKGPLDRADDDLSHDNEANVDDDASAGGDPTRLAIADEWPVRGDYVVRVHHMPRVTLVRSYRGGGPATCSS